MNGRRGRPDDEVVRVPPQVVAHIRLVAPVVGELHAESDRDPARNPALGRLADDALALRKGRGAVCWRPRFEIDVVGDGQLVDPAFERLSAYASISTSLSGERLL